MLMEAQGKLIYHVMAASPKVFDSSLHLKELGAPMMAIYVLMGVTCLYGSPRLSNLDKEVF